ncbi:uncharacterized protein LOC144751858 [Ciona intestinalis]
MSTRSNISHPAESPVIDTPSPVETPERMATKLKDLASAKPAAGPTDLQPIKTKIDNLYIMAEKAILARDETSLKFLRDELEEAHTRLFNFFNPWIESLQGEARDNAEQELQLILRSKKEFEVRILELPCPLQSEVRPKSVPERTDQHVTERSIVASSRSSRTRFSTTSTSASARERRQALVERELAFLEMQRNEAHAVIESKQLQNKQSERKLDATYAFRIADAKARILNEPLQPIELKDESTCSDPAAGTRPPAPSPVSVLRPEPANHLVKNTTPEVISDHSRADQQPSPRETYCEQTAQNYRNNNTPLVKLADVKHASSFDTADVFPSIVRAVGEGMHMPRPEYLTFSGDPMDYWMFIRNFEANLESKVTDDKLKMTLLMQQCKGKAKSLIHHCSVLDPHEGYIEARKILYETCGKPHVVARAFVKELTDGPNLKPDDAAGIRRYAQILQKCLLILRSINNLGDLNTVDRLVSLANKLPYESQKLWRRRVARIQSRFGSEATFPDLVEFVNEEAAVANTLNGQLCVFRKNDDNKKVNRPKARFATCANNVTQFGAEAPQGYPVKGYPSCYCCSGNHYLSKCEVFRKWTLEQRRDFLRERFRCFNCFGSRHTSRTCSKRSACNVEGCNRMHHGLLHDNKPSVASNGKDISETRRTSNNVTSANCNSVKKTSSSYFCVIPVKLYANGKELATHAFLDQGSDTTFCDKRVIERLGLSGKSRQVTMNTVGRRPVKHDGFSVDFTVTSLDGSVEIQIEDALSIDRIPVFPNPKPSAMELELLPHLRDLDLPDSSGGEVLLLIGTDVPYAHRVLEVRTGETKHPFAARTPLGWSLVGPSLRYPAIDNVHVNFLLCSEQLDERIQRSWTENFTDDPRDLPFPTSVEDRHVLQLMQETVKHSHGHYYLPLPWRSGISLPSGSRQMAERRLSSLKNRLYRDEALKEKYVNQIQDYIDKNFAEVISNPEVESGKHLWYLPHHPVFHPRKPDKVRIVFDCAAQYKGVSLNDAILQGPDLVNSIVGVLTRFRKGKVALVADVESMFHQVRVQEPDYDAFRFLWWPGGELSKPAVEHRMLVHIFGATSSPSLAAFCLRRTAEEFGDRFSASVADIVKNNFYVDDCLTSADTVKDAIALAQQLRALLQLGGFRLTKWMSSHQEVLDEIPAAERAKTITNVHLQGSVKERVLGVHWSVKKDEFGFDVSNSMEGKKFTRRNILSAVNTLYDPLGFAAPVTLVARILQQEIVRKKLDWDDELPEADINEWNNWLNQLPDLHKLTLPRCFIPPSLEKYQCTISLMHQPMDTELTESIPRLELAAAVLAVKADKWLRSQLNFPNCESIFWTDSCAVRQSICNVGKRFHTFVANRLAKIHRQTVPSQWKHVNSKLNPADIASRGMSVQNLIKSRWLKGPTFLWQTEEFWPKPPEAKRVIPNEFQPIDRKPIAVNLCTQLESTDRLIDRYSSLEKLKVSVAWLMRYKSYLRQKGSVTTGKLNTAELNTAENEVIKYVQRQAFASVIEFISSETADVQSDRCSRRKLKRQSRWMSKLNPMLVGGILRIGGRLENAMIAFDLKHPVILPYDHKLTELIVNRHHRMVGHSGPAHTWTSLRQRFWIARRRRRSKNITQLYALP